MNNYWLNKHLDQWRESLSSDRKPQAVIFNGSQGMGKSILLEQIIADLLCRISTPACGECQNCRLNHQGYHPDVDRLIPENNLIKVKMIRSLTDFFISTPHCSDHKIAVIEEAHLMNPASANALLKVLEEPPSRGLLFLVTDSKHRLMPTIRSRCISLNVMLNANEKQQLLPWLQQQGQWTESHVLDALMLTDWQPLTALDLLKSDGVEQFNQYLDLLYHSSIEKQSVSEVAKLLAEIESLETWQLLHRYNSQLIKSLLKPNIPTISAKHPLNQLIKKKPKVLHIIVKFADMINVIMINFNTQIKKQLLIESLLIDLKRALNRGS